MGLTTIDNKNIFHKDVIGNVRTAQEDSHDIAALTPNGDVFVVCDGMGGHVGGKQASSIAVKSIIEYLKKEKYPQPIQVLKDALQFANMQILGYTNDHPELKGMGTTACIVLLQESEAYIAHVGDSRIYLFLGKEKQLHRITKDHSFVQTLVDAGQITDEEAEHHPNKNIILSALGLKADLSPSISMVQPKNGDIFLICSDGLSGMISDSKIQDVLMQNTSLEHKGTTLIDLALEAGGIDNITLELVQIANSPHNKSVFMSQNPATGKNVEKKTLKNFRRLAKILSVIIACALIVCGVYKILQKRADEHKVEQIKSEIATLTKNSDVVSDLIKVTKDSLEIINKNMDDLERAYLNDPDAELKALIEKINKKKEKLESNQKCLRDSLDKIEKCIKELENHLDSLNK